MKKQVLHSSGKFAVRILLSIFVQFQLDTTQESDTSHYFNFIFVVLRTLADSVRAKILKGRATNSIKAGGIEDIVLPRGYILSMPCFPQVPTPDLTLINHIW